MRQSSLALALLLTVGSLDSQPRAQILPADPIKEIGNIKIGGKKIKDHGKKIIDTANDANKIIKDVMNEGNKILDHFGGFSYEDQEDENRFYNEEFNTDELEKQNEHPEEE